MKKEKRREGARPGARRLRIMFFAFYALLRRAVFLPIRRVQGRGTESYASLFVTVLTAPFVYLSKLRNLSFALEGVLPRSFLPRCSLC